MSQTVITAAFEQWKAQEAAGGNPVVLDGFVLANVPGLDPDIPISNTEGMPPNAQIVYRQDVDKVGVVNNNAVVYSITMGSNVGTFDFNWIGLVNKASGTVAMIVHAPVQRKLKTEAGQQGNTINRSFLMEYDGAATETQINTPAQTWQIDFTARLAGMDEVLRLANVDTYGAGAFFGDGYLVTKNGAQYAVTAGSGYVGGIRTTLASTQDITVGTKPAKVWLDVSWQGALTGQWHAVTAISVSATDLTDHTDANGFAHYVFAVAAIDASGAVKDLRPIGSLSNQLTDDKVAKAGDTMTGPLGIKSTVTVYEDDVNTISEFLYSYNETGVQTKKVGIKAICDADGAGHWVVDVNPAAKGDSRVQAFGIDGKSKIVTTMNSFKLYEGTARVFSPNNPQLMFGVGMGPVDKADAYGNIGQIYRVNATAKNKPPAVSGNVSAGVVCVPMDAAPSAGYFAVVGVNMAAYVGFSQSEAGGITWSRLYTDKYKPTAADMNALPLSGGTMTGEVGSTSPNIWRGIQGDYGSIWRMDANNSYFLLTNKGDQNGNFNSLRPLTINNNTGNVDISTALSIGSQNSIYKTGINSYSDGGGSYHQTNGMTLQGVGDQVGEMYFLENIGKYACLGFHVRSGARDAWVEFRNDGDFYINGTNAVPVGVIEAWPSDTPPTGWLMCDGSGFNTGIFPSLARIFPSGQLPDLRGAFLRAKDNGKGVDPNRTLLSIQPGQAPASAIGGRGWGDYAQRDTGYTADTGTDNTGHYSVKQETEAQRETRPYNVAINYIVRAA
ncbi:phage tail-collar fiber domain-containing protein [Serratia marcescens]|uniref:phage tail-collar fiber domain-containing protein n=1 Tax=Serratia marcescens TaxID=615 RepID=UPI002179F9E2|nr:phage tail protein [Serratia marcescens]CAI1951262.1 Tail fiber protein [Serratia marcescens]